MQYTLSSIYFKYDFGIRQTVKVRTSVKRTPTTQVSKVNLSTCTCNTGSEGFILIRQPKVQIFSNCNVVLISEDKSV